MSKISYIIFLGALGHGEEGASLPRPHTSALRCGAGGGAPTPPFLGVLYWLKLILSTINSNRANKKIRKNPQ